MRNRQTFKIAFSCDGWLRSSGGGIMGFKTRQGRKGLKQAALASYLNSYVRILHVGIL